VAQMRHDATERDGGEGQRDAGPASAGGWQEACRRGSVTESVAHLAGGGAATDLDGVDRRACSWLGRSGSTQTVEDALHIDRRVQQYGLLA
jgi:hypothetical protein